MMLNARHVIIVIYIVVSLFSVMTTDSKFCVYSKISVNGMQIISPHLRKCYLYVKLWRKYSFRVCIICILYEMFACVKKVYYILKTMGSNVRPNSSHHLNHKPITIPPTDGLLPVSRQCLSVDVTSSKHLPTYSHTVQVISNLYGHMNTFMLLQSRKRRKTYWSNPKNKE